jgi:hypothetical protein
MKRCTVCKLEKPPEEFHRDATKRDGLQTACKACTKARNAKLTIEKRAYYRERSKARYEAKGRAENAERYSRYRDACLLRRNIELRSARGRLYSLFAIARDRARRADLPFSIDLAWVLDTWERQEGLCALSALPLTLDRNPPGERFFNPFNPSLDRRIPALGYTPENTRLVCVIVNLALNGFGDEAFLRMCRAVEAHHRPLV